MKLTAYGLHSLENNRLTNNGKDMTGVAAIAEALKVNKTLQSVKYAANGTQTAAMMPTHGKAYVHKSVNTP